MTTQEQENFILRMYHDLFREASTDKISEYCAPDFVEENNYDVLDYGTFVQHVEAISEQTDKASFDLEFIVNIPGQVVVRALVYLDDQIKGAPPASLLISYWQFNEQGKVNYCKEVEYATA